MKIDFTFQIENPKALTSIDILRQSRIYRLLLGFKLSELNGLLNQLVVQL